MSNCPNDPFQDLLNRHSDGQLRPDEASQFAEQLEQQARRREELGLQEEIDAVLRGAFAPAGDANSVLQRLTDSRQTAVEPSAPAAAGPTKQRSVGSVGLRRNWILAALVVTSAILAWLAVGIPGLGPVRRPVAFIQKPLEQIYQEEVARGFHEYWVCEEKPRFAATFYLRHGQALQLTAFPAGTRMKGLSYLAGLSRDTTAMLAVVDSKPVLVFVDKIEHDGLKAPQGADAVGLHRFRRELGNLVLYEVTPFDEPRVMPYLESVEPPRDYLQQLPNHRDAPRSVP